MKNKHLLATVLIMGVIIGEKVDASNSCPLEITYKDLKTLDEHGHLLGEYKNCRVAHRDPGFSIAKEDKNKRARFLGPHLPTSPECAYELRKDHTHDDYFYLYLDCKPGG